MHYCNTFTIPLLYWEFARRQSNSPVGYLGCWPEAPTIHLDLSEKVVLLVEHLQGLVEETLKYAVGR